MIVKNVLCTLIVMNIIFIFILLIIIKNNIKLGFDINKNYMDGVDIIYWINLDRSQDRRTHMEKLLKEPEFKNVKHQRFPAIDGKNMDLSVFFDSEQKDKINDSNKSEYACLLSHLETIRIFSESYYNNALIFEDDVTMDLKHYWNKSIREIIKEAPNDWEIIQLCYINVNGGKMGETFNHWFPSTAAYIINKKGAKHLMNLKENNIYNLTKHNVDTSHSDMFIYSYLKTYCYQYPMFVYKKNNDSLLHDYDLIGHEISRELLLDMYKKEEQK